MQYTTLSNGIQMPLLGYGVFQVPPQEAERCVADALSVGYRLIDTAQAYNNEEGVGAAIAKSGISREDIFLVTKVWISNNGEAKAAASIDESLRKLQTDYIDLLLIHQAYGDVYGIVKNETLAAIGAKYGKSAAQVALRWLTECGIVAIPKSSHKERMAQNFNIFDFTLTADEMQLIATLNEHDEGQINFQDPQFVKYLIETYG